MSSFSSEFEDVRTGFVLDFSQNSLRNGVIVTKKTDQLDKISVVTAKITRLKTKDGRCDSGLGIFDINESSADQ